jgi:ribonuclease HI
MAQSVLTSKPISWVSPLSAALGMVLSVGLAYGAARYAQGENRQSITTLEKRLDNTPTREELKAHIDALQKIQETNAEFTKIQLRDIKEAVVDIGKEVHKLR